MRSHWNICLLLGLQLLAVTAYGQQTSVIGLRHWIAADHSRLVFDLSSSPSHQVFLLENPARLVIDLANAHLTGKLSQPAPNHPFVTKVRSAPRNNNDLRVVVDLKQWGEPKTFTLAPNQGQGHRLVVDLFPKQHVSPKATVQPVASKPSVEPVVAKAATTALKSAPLTTAKAKPAVSAHAPQKPTKALKTAVHRKRDVIIAVDAGHGGDDPGARGPHGTREKDVTFSIAKKLADMINRKPGMKAVLVRKGDYYIDLRKRMKIAREAKADLFISIHADAFHDASVKGASVFTLSNRGATSEAARWLANHENASDLVGGVSLDDKDDVLASVLLDLSQTATQEASVNVAGKVLSNLKQIGHLHQHSVQKAGFMVLKSPDVPSILVETAFISNPTEENKLRNHAHQVQLAQAIFNGVNSYFRHYAPVETRIASNSQKHTISRGETLSGIAQQYGVSMRKIKSINAMSSNQVRIGQVLDIPTDS
ncbi:MAG: N-acetylmuramoyl-L-alanine amidase [Gammaproteobacteria bacterium]